MLQISEVKICFWFHGKLLRFVSKVSTAHGSSVDKKIDWSHDHSIICLWSFYTIFEIEIYQWLHLSIYELMKSLQICHYLVKLLMLVAAIYLHLSIKSKANQLVTPSYIRSSSRFQSGVAAVWDKAISIISSEQTTFLTSSSTSASYSCHQPLLSRETKFVQECHKWGKQSEFLQLCDWIKWYWDPQFRRWTFESQLWTSNWWPWEKMRTWLGLVRVLTCER